MSNYNSINEQLLEVKLAGEQVYAKKGAMIAYKGEIDFKRSFLAEGGVQDLAMRRVTNEGFTIMSAEGTGEVYYAYYGLYTTIIPLRGETFYVESSSLLVFDSCLRIGTMFQGNQGAIQGIVKGLVTDQGLFTTTLQGVGELAIVSKGNAIGLDVTPQKPIFVDPNAYIGHKGQLSSNFVTDLSWKNLIGQASGESYQFEFTGSGTVYIQASER